MQIAIRPISVPYCLERQKRWSAITVNIKKMPRALRMCSISTVVEDAMDDEGRTDDKTTVGGQRIGGYRMMATAK